MTERDLPKYYQSFAEELNIVQNRVRNIIVNSHWPSDGNYKEAVLKEILRRIIPSKYEIGSGFVVSNDGNQNSKQIDILIYDNASPILFKSADFIILPSDYVKAVIEVKSNIGNGDQLESALGNLLAVQKIVAKNSEELYAGIFSYEFSGLNCENMNQRVERIFSRISEFYMDSLTSDEDNRTFLSKNILNSLCINNQLYGIHWNELSRSNRPEFAIYNTQKQSFNFFVSNLLSTLDKTVINSDQRIWYPSEKQSSLLVRRCLLAQEKT